MPFQFNPCQPCCCTDPLTIKASWGVHANSLNTGAEMLTKKVGVGTHCGDFHGNTAAFPYLNISGEVADINGFGPNYTIVTAFPNRAWSDGLTTDDHIDVVLHLAWNVLQSTSTSDWRVDLEFTLNGVTQTMSYTTYSTTWGDCIDRPALIVRVYRDCTFDVLGVAESSCCPSPPANLVATFWTDGACITEADPMTVFLTYDPIAKWWVGNWDVTCSSVSYTAWFYLECLVSGQFRAYVYFWRSSVIGFTGFTANACSITDFALLNAECSPAFLIADTTLGLFTSSSVPCSLGTSLTFTVTE